MTKRPRHRATRGRLTLTLGALLLLTLGSGCVAWDPIFRGSMSVASLLSSIFRIAHPNA